MIHAALLHDAPATATLVLIHGGKRGCIACCGNFFATSVPSIGAIRLHGLSPIQRTVMLSALF